MEQRAGSAWQASPEGGATILTFAIKPITATKLEPVLVVEDDPDTRALVCEALDTEGWQSVAVGDGHQALDWLHERRPSLVILDLVLPDLAGEDVAHAIHARYGKTVPILVTTGADHPQQRSREVGTLFYLRKPFLLEDLAVTATALLTAAS